MKKTILYASSLVPEVTENFNDIAWIFFSGLGEVYLEHQKRILFIEYQNLIKERDALKTEWQRIQIELSQLSSGLRLEDIDRSKVKMSIPNEKIFEAIINRITPPNDNIELSSIFILLSY